jgi:hypothetical protein
MYFNGEYTWQQFQSLGDIKRLPLQEQIRYYNQYLSDLSIQRSLIESAYQNANQFQSFQGNAASAAGSGGNPVTASFYPVGFVFASTSASVCYSASVFPVTIYYAPSSSIQLGHVLYTNSNLEVAATASAGFYSYGPGWFRVSGSGIVVASGSCSNIASSVGLAYNSNYITGTGSACVSASLFREYSTDYYLDYNAAGTTIDLGDTLYTNSSLTAFASSGSYSDGTKFYRVSGSGVVRFSGSCA